MFPIYPKAVLALADGTVFSGRSVGAAGSSIGEVVFNTGMSGYQEILTDPSYCEQLVTFTYPHIGNCGVNCDDEQSAGVQVAGVIMRDLSAVASNFRSQDDLGHYLQQRNAVAIADIDTRQLTRLLRDKGAQNGAIVALAVGEEINETVLTKARQLAAAAPSMNGKDLAIKVSTKEKYLWNKCSWQLGRGFKEQTEFDYHVVAMDFGVKRAILTLLSDRKCKVTVVPAQTTAADILALKPDGIFLSNGPGDPQACSYAVATIKELLAAQKPIFGICLGHQLLALSMGARTFKMKFGHHGSNHPVKDLISGKVCITSQNHGFAVDKQSLTAQIEVTHLSLFDGTLQGMRHKELPVLSFQGHPEVAPGPNDIAYLFDNFVTLMADRKHG